MARKAPAANPQSHASAPEPRKPQLDENGDHQTGGPAKPQKLVVAKPIRHGWCKFRAKGRCYVEGALLEDSEQEISLSPAGSYRQRSNKNLELVDGEIPVMAEDAPTRPHKNDTLELRRAFQVYEESFIDSLEDGDPRVGAAPGGMKLIKQ